MCYCRWDHMVVFYRYSLSLVVPKKALDYITHSLLKPLSATATHATIGLSSAEEGKKLSTPRII